MRRLGIRSVLLVLFGPIVWAAHLLVVYATHSSFCAAAGRSAHADSRPLVVLVLAGATAVALLLLTLPVCWPRRFASTLVDTHPAEEAGFVLSLMRWLAGLSLIAVSASALAMVIVPTCPKPDGRAEFLTMNREVECADGVHQITAPMEKPLRRRALIGTCARFERRRADADTDHVEDELRHQRHHHACQDGLQETLLRRTPRASSLRWRGHCVPQPPPSLLVYKA